MKVVALHCDYLGTIAVRLWRDIENYTIEQDHTHYSIDTKSYGIRGQWTCIRRRFSKTDPLERSWGIEVANANFRKSKPRYH